MAIENKTIVHGVALPYCKVGGYSGDKRAIQVMICRQASKDNEPLLSNIVELTGIDSSELSDSITKLIYNFLKDKSYLIGDDC